MEIDLNEVKNEAFKKQKARRKYIERIRKNKSAELDKLFNEVHNDVFKKIDCLECANCCKTVGPLFTDKDISRISKKLKITPGKFTERYLKIDEEQDYVLNKLPCPFLVDGNCCSIYSFRPKACYEYPHTQMKNQKKVLKLHLLNCKFCPGVNEIFNRIL